IGEATAEKMKDYRIVIWPNHGIYGTGATFDEAFGLVETVEKSAMIYMMVYDKKIINPLTDENLKELAAAFKLNYRKDFLD
ncbi:MAG: class II aldolase/adducin family protein, partial [Erysipelotrichaceae bacterium]|nr:class II aldolase/adducin family protein [Erysipelotrichaceae bacterium]